MSGKNKKQFAVWMDGQHAIIVGREQIDSGEFKVLAHAKNEISSGHSSEHSINNAERTELKKYFKEISSHMQNAEELHVTGTGDVQEHFINYMSETPQFKNTVTNESTSNKMGDEKLVEFISQKFS